MHFPLFFRYLREIGRRCDEKDCWRARSWQSVRGGTFQRERRTQQGVRSRSIPRKAKEIFRPVDSWGIQRKARVRWICLGKCTDRWMEFCFEGTLWKPTQVWLPHKVRPQMQCFSFIMSIYSCQYSKCLFHALQLKEMFAIYEATPAWIGLVSSSRKVKLILAHSEWYWSQELVQVKP